MRLILSITFLFFNVACFAQAQNVYYVKNIGQLVDTKDSADYFRVVSEPDSGSTLYNVKEYYKSGKVKLIAKSTTIEPQQYDGQLIGFYEDGKRKELATYSKGLRLQTNSYYANGKLKSAIEYPVSLSGQNIYQKDKLVIYNDSTGKALVENGNGHFAGYETIAPDRYNDGNVINGFKDGIWTGSYPIEKTTFIEEYKNGKLVSGECVTAKNKKFKYKSLETPPDLGDMDNLMTMIANGIRVEKGYAQGRVLVTFIINKSGEAADFKVKRSLNEELDRKAVQAVRNALKYLKGITPGIQYGHTVNISFTLPVAFG
jgi:TonB family protein